MNEETLLVCSTFPDTETARWIARQLVTEKFAACANIVPAVESIYRWQGKVEDGEETFVFFKTTAARYPAFQEKLKSLHPYDVPEIIALKISDGLPEYLKWVDRNTKPN
ncbi:MAG: divalent-cation tolerance protein CutA [Chthoniobacterales bacterium]|nr:MAG: divalent-cation tolerance protein CutA [Chthoniobacterales bacterium]